LARTAWPNEVGVSQAEKDRARSTISAILWHIPQTEYPATNTDTPSREAEND
jgi:hypothetical protein